MNEHNFLSHGEHAGYVWFTRRNSLGFRMGYVVIPTGHPWHGEEDYYRLDVDVHGGLTFAGPAKDFPPTQDIEAFNDCFIIGFDCGHYGDALDPELVRPDWSPPSRFFEGVVCTQDYVERECRRLCDQVNEAEK